MLNVNVSHKNIQKIYNNNLIDEIINVHISKWKSYCYIIKTIPVVQSEMVNTTREEHQIKQI